jgi:hypothetical protein
MSSETANLAAFVYAGGWHDEEATDRVPALRDRRSEVAVSSKVGQGQAPRPC